MIPPRTMTRFAATRLLVTVFVALAAAAVGCGGGNDSTTTSGPVAAFTADSPTPVDGTIALLAGSSTGASVDVRVTATGVTGFFGAAFRIKYDTTALLFNGMTDSGSFLRVGVTDADVFFLADATSVPGEVLISATRIDPTIAPPVDVTVTSDLVVLNFIARLAIPAGTTPGRLDFGDPKQVCDGTVDAPGCGAVAITSWAGGGVSAQ
jgi:hypothetical protein